MILGAAHSTLPYILPFFFFFIKERYDFIKNLGESCSESNTLTKNPSGLEDQAKLDHKKRYVVLEYVPQKRLVCSR